MIRVIVKVPDGGLRVAVFVNFCCFNDGSTNSSGCCVPASTVKVYNKSNTIWYMVISTTQTTI